MYLEDNKNILKPMWKDLLKHSKEINIPLNLEHRNLLIAILAGNLLPDIKKQFVVGWVDQPMISLRLQPNSLRNWEQMSLSDTFLHN